jgi:hypothetical protein
VHHNAENIVAWTLYLALPLLLVGPYLIGFFAGSNGSVCFVFSFGILVAGQGYVMDPPPRHSPLRAQCRWSLVLPFICSAALRHQTLASSSFRVSRFAWSVAGFRVAALPPRPGHQNAARRRCRALAPFPFFSHGVGLWPDVVNSMVDRGAAASFPSPTFISFYSPS